MTRTFAIVAVAAALLGGCDPAGDDVVGPEGGSVVSRDGRLVLDIPAGALSEATEITIEESDDLPDGAVGPSYRVLPMGTVFEAPVHVFYHYGTNDEAGAVGLDLPVDDVELVVERDDSWARLADRRVSSDEAIVSASALYLSAFGVVERDAE